VTEIQSADPLAIELVPVRGGTLIINGGAGTTAKITDGNNLWIKQGQQIQLSLPVGEYRIYLVMEDQRERVLTVTISENVITVAKAD
jgi:hypothetical protein